MPPAAGAARHLCSVGAVIREQLPPHRTATYVLPRYKAVYVSVPKAACTSLKWLVADLQGEDRERFYRSLSREVGRAMCIHRRSLFQYTPMLRQLDDEQLAEISPDNGWFVFAVVRHPSARLFSGWQSKFLLHEPRFMAEFGDNVWIPPVPSTSQEIVDGFRRFALALAEHPEQRVLRDRHFMQQRRMLTPNRTPYTRIYDTREIPQLLSDFETHLRAQGWGGDKLELMQSNETPLLPVREMFTGEVGEAITALYGEDFEQFSYDGVVPPKLHDGSYGPQAIAEVGRLVDRHERIGDLAMRAQHLNEQRKQRLQAARQRAPAASRPRARLRAVLRRVRAHGRSAARRLRSRTR